MVGNIYRRKLNRTRFYIFIGIEKLIFINSYTIRNLLFRLAGLKINRMVNIRSGVKFVTRNIIIGSGTFINTGCIFIASEGSQIRIGKNVDVAPGCSFITGTHKVGDGSRRAGLGYLKDIEIGDGAWIGANSTILPGVIIGSGCIVAAGSVVTKSVGANVLIAGVPAKVKKFLP